LTTDSWPLKKALLHQQGRVTPRKPFYYRILRAAAIDLRAVNCDQVASAMPAARAAATRPRDRIVTARLFAAQHSRLAVFNPGAPAGREDRRC
jgi:hypothetical protein